MGLFFCVCVLLHCQTTQKCQARPKTIRFRRPTNTTAALNRCLSNSRTLEEDLKLGPQHHARRCPRGSEVLSGLQGHLHSAIHKLSPKNSGGSGTSWLRLMITSHLITGQSKFIPVFVDMTMSWPIFLEFDMFYTPCPNLHPDKFREIILKCSVTCLGNQNSSGNPSTLENLPVLQFSGLHEPHFLFLLCSMLFSQAPF